MREPARDKGRVEDILEAADYIKQFTDGVQFPSFLSDKLRYFAVLKNVEIVGEAAYMLSSEFKEAYPDLPWSQMHPSFRKSCGKRPRKKSQRWCRRLGKYTC